MVEGINKKTFLVTGADGFVGSHLVESLLEAGAYVRAFVFYNSWGANGWLDELDSIGSGNIDIMRGDIRDPQIVQQAITGCDYVFHLSSLIAIPYSYVATKSYVDTNVMGTLNVLQACRDLGTVKRIVHVSTSEVYGTAESETMDEKHPLMPMSPYASAKCGADRLVYSYWQTYKLPLVTIRPFNMYGPRQHLEKVIPRFITSILLGEPLTVHGDGSAARDFMFADDLCRGIHMVLDAEEKMVSGEVFNMATGTHRSIQTIAEKVMEEMNVSADQVSYIGDRPGQVFRHTGNNKKAHRILGWEPLVTWEDGLKRTIEWYQENEEFWRKQLWMRSIPIITEAGKVELH